MNNKLNQLEQEMAVQEFGWKRDGGLWINPERTPKRFTALSSVLLFEWRQALARAGRAEHEVERQRNIVGMIVLSIACLVAALAVLAGILRPF